MIFGGLVMVLFGFGVAVLSVGITASTGGRLILVLIGIAISLVGIMGVLNRAYMKNAIWKK